MKFKEMALPYSLVLLKRKNDNKRSFRKCKKKTSILSSSSKTGKYKLYIRVREAAASILSSSSKTKLIKEILKLGIEKDFHTL